MPSLSRGLGSQGGGGFRRSDNGEGSGLLAALLVAVSVVLVTVSVREGGSGVLSSTRAVFQTITSPVRIAGSALASPFSGLGNVMRNLTADESTLSELEEQNRQLTAQNAELQEAQQTASRLEDLLSLQSTYNLQSTAARIISGSSDSWSRTVTLDKGTAQGLAVGMPVADSNGAIGEIVECGPSTSTVRLLADENSSVSAMVQSSRAQGTLAGSPDGTLRLTMISTDQEVNVGDNVVTSGLGGVFPKGLPVGTVSSVVKSPGSLYYDIVIDPLSRAENFEEVLVITSLTDGQAASSDDIQAADAQDSGSDAGDTNANANASANASASANGTSDNGNNSSQNASASANGNATSASVGGAGGSGSQADDEGE